MLSNTDSINKQTIKNYNNNATEVDREKYVKLLLTSDVFTREVNPLSVPHNKMLVET